MDPKEDRGEDKERRISRERRRERRIRRTKLKGFIYFLRSPLRKSHRAHPRSYNLLFLGELLRPDVRASQLDVEHALHGGQDLLVGRRGAALKVLDDGDGGVAFGGELLLRHLVALLVAAALDRLGDLHADRLRLDDVVRAVDLGQVLAFDFGRASSLKASQSVTCSISCKTPQRRVGGIGNTYSIASRVFLLRRDDETGTLGSVQGAASLDNGLTRRTATTVLAANASNVVPVALHFERCEIRNESREFVESRKR